jgi:hypothetical protein
VNVFKFFQRRANAQRAVNLRLFHGQANLPKFSFELRKVKVAMGVCKHEKSLEKGRFQISNRAPGQEKRA